MADCPETPYSRDVRMRGFVRRRTVDDALAWIDTHTHPLPAEMVDLALLRDRTLAADVVSRVEVPHFDRAMMDGFAVRAADTLGASPYNRLKLELIGQVLPGQLFSGNVGCGQAVEIMTGAAVPEGADAVLPAETTESHSDQLFALDQVSPGKHLGRRGEDIGLGATVLRQGRRLRPQDIGVLASIGVRTASVVRRPRVRIVITGNELVPAGTPLSGSRIVDANGPMLATLIARDGGIPRNPGIVPDNPNAILRAMQDEADIVVVSGGSSVGREDFAPSLLARHGDLAIHGVAMRPSSPSGIGTLGDRLVFLLPGNPVSCLCAYDFFAGRAVRILAGRSPEWPYRNTEGTLARKISSSVGRVDYARVRFRETGIEPLAIGGASSLSSTTQADGFVLVPADSEGRPAGATVQVWLYD